MPSVHFCRGYTANALIPPQESSSPPPPKQLQPPFLSRFSASHWNALLTFGWSVYPNRTRARAMFPVVQRWPFFPALGANPPSAVAIRRSHSSHAFAIRGSSFVSPRSDNVSNIQFVERYFGPYRLSSLTHQPSRCCWANRSAAHPFSGMSSFAARTSGASCAFPTSCVRAKYRIEG